MLFHTISNQLGCIFFFTKRELSSIDSLDVFGFFNADVAFSALFITSPMTDKLFNPAEFSWIHLLIP